MTYCEDLPSRPPEAPARICPDCGAPAFAEALECPNGHRLPLPRPIGPTVIGICDRRPRADRERR